MNLPEHDIVFEVDSELKEHWLDGWGGSSGTGRVARGFIVAGVVGTFVFVLLARGALMVAGAAGCLLVSLGFFLAVRRDEGAATSGVSEERLVIDHEGYLLYACRDERELVDTGDDRYFWGRSREPRRVRASVAYLPECTFRMLGEYRELVIEPRREGAVRARRFSGARDLEASGVLRTHLHAGRTPKEFLAAGPWDADIAIELFPYFSPDLAQTLRDLGVSEAPERRAT